MCTFSSHILMKLAHKIVSANCDKWEMGCSFNGRLYKGPDKVDPRGRSEFNTPQMGCELIRCLSSSAGAIPRSCTKELYQDQ